MLINLIIVLIIAGAVLYLMRFLPIDGTVKTIIQAVVVIVLVLYVIIELVAPFLQSRGMG